MRDKSYAESAIGYQVFGVLGIEVVGGCTLPGAWLVCCWIKGGPDFVILPSGELCMRGCLWPGLLLRYTASDFLGETSDGDTLSSPSRSTGKGEPPGDGGAPTLQGSKEKRWDQVPDHSPVSMKIL